jgi:hypothetical protein
MRTLIYFFIFVLFFTFNSSMAQEVVELPFQPLDSNFITLVNTLEEIEEADDSKSIDLCINALNQFDDQIIRYNLIYRKLAFYYASLKQYDKCFDILKKGQEEGLYYFIREGNRIYPPFLKELANNSEYESFIEQNKLLKNEANKTANTEYMIQLPDGYNDTKKYPLFLVMHGGIGSIRNLQKYYSSPKLQNDYIVAYFQGSTKQGTSSRSFAREKWRSGIKDGFEQIIQKYPVDTNNVIIAGPSAGGARSILLGLNNIIPSKGLLLSYAVAPRNLDSLVYKESAKRGLKIALLCGENDWAIKQQKELGYKFDKYGIPNRFVVFPEKGHEFPDNWSYYLDTSLEFILKEE